VVVKRRGTVGLVVNGGEGTVSIFSISGKTVTPVGLLKLGDEKIGASHVAISPDGRTALVSRDGDDRISVLSIDGTKVEYTKRDLNAGLRPYGLDISADGTYAAVANIGRGGGDSDTVSLIDMKAAPPRVVDTITVGQTPEGLKISPDGKWIAAVVMNGSNKAKNSPFFSDAGKLVLLRPDGGRLVKVAEAPIGHWSQGVAFSTDGKTVLVGNMVEKNLQVFDWNGATLKEAATIKLNGGSAAVRIADK
jgi:DNA-binding beta-propeller fold protein YncE